MDEQYVKKLENVIKQMLQPLREIPFSLVIEAISGHRVIPFSQSDPQDRRLLQDLVKVANLAGSEINRNPIIRSRPNEVGNDIEAYVKRALEKLDFPAAVPKAKSGKKKAAGYPDIEFTDHFERTNYLECKTYNIENLDTTQRSFYFSPSDDFKITQDGHHFVLSFETYVASRKKNSNIYKCRHWKILTIEKLTVDVKYEFNADNRRLYAGELVLAEGDLKKEGNSSRNKK